MFISRLLRYPSVIYSTLYSQFSTRISAYHYDLFVIGGGSAGIALSREAASLGKKVALCDWVQPTPMGTTWGIGGTCVNVGCVPKKMMHQAAILYQNLKDFPLIGYTGKIEKEKDKHDWNTLVENIQNYVKKLNFGYRGVLRNKKVSYFNKKAKIINNNSIELSDMNGGCETITSENIVIALGGRPAYPDYPGARETCITSDDLFSLKRAPGKTLIIGASYIALECGGFVHSLGYDTTVLVRSILLRGFDQGMARKLGDFMSRQGIKFKNKCIPTKFTKLPNEKILVEYINVDTKTQYKDIFDTCLIATGRSPTTRNLGLEKLGITTSKSGKVVVNSADQTNVPNIFAIGDCAEGRPELTPPAIMAGKLLARRLYSKSTQLMDYTNIPTTVFTPIEYGSCGLSEETAIQKYGKLIKVYHSEFTPLEWSFDLENEDTCYIKVIVNTAESNRIVGFHILSPNAGEITQGIAVAMKCGLTKDQLNLTVGIHPTIAEEYTTLDVTTDQGDGKKGSC